MLVAADDDVEDEEARDKRPRGRSQRSRYLSFAYGVLHVLLALSAHPIASAVEPHAKAGARVAVALLAFNGLVWMLAALTMSQEYLSVVEKHVDPLDGFLLSVNATVTTVGFAYAFGLRGAAALCLVGLSCALHGLAQLSLEHAVYYAECLRIINARETPRVELFLPFAVTAMTYLGPMVEVLAARTELTNPRTARVFSALALAVGVRLGLQALWVANAAPYSAVFLSSKATQFARLGCFLYCFAMHPF